MFVGRKQELDALEKLHAKKSFQMVVLYGRRRVGKTTLATKFCEGKRALYFTALEQSDADNLADFTREIKRLFNLPSGLGSFGTWADAFSFLAERAREEPFVLVIDEFPYAAKENPALPSMLQVAIDRELKSTGLFLVLSGSNQGFMESKVLGKKSPLHGRRTAQMKLQPLGYRDAALMTPWADAQEAFRYYGCLGGVPYYLSLVDPGLTFRENIAELFFNPTGLLYGEPSMLLRQELREPALYNSILRAIAGGANRSGEIANRTGIAGSTLPRYLKTLTDLGIVEKVVPFGENPETSKRGIYRLKDAAYDFWYHFVMPHATDVEAGAGALVARALTDEQIDTYLGHRFERLAGEWLLGEALAGRLPVQATAFGSWWGTDPDLREQADIDVLAANRTQRKLVAGECKYRESFDETEAIERLTHRSTLVKGYKPEALYLFTKHPVSKSTASKHAGDSINFVSLDSMYVA